MRIESGNMEGQSSAYKATVGPSPLLVPVVTDSSTCRRESSEVEVDRSD